MTGRMQLIRIANYEKNTVYMPGEYLQESHGKVHHEGFGAEARL